MESIFMYSVQNASYFAVAFMTFVMGVVFGHTSGTKAIEDVSAQRVRAERDLAIKAGVGRYVADPEHGSTSFTYGPK